MQSTVLCLVALCALGAGSVSEAQNAPVTPTNDTEEVVVTGSRIPRSANDITPDIIVISSKDIEDRGFKNAFDALNTLTQNTGFTQGADYGNTFTPAANTISLRGLGPNHTLILINGQRVADYPIAYNGSVNFVNLADIPSAAIDRIEILNGSASAIYGSDAIAGVVNIILKDHAEGLDVNLKGGTTQHGGGGNGRFQATGGETFDKLSTTFAIEVSRVQPIWAENRSFMTSTTLQGAPPGAVWSAQDLTGGNYIAPPNNCAAFAGLFQNSTAPYNTGSGSFCGSGKVLPTYWTTQTGNQGENLYASAKYELSSHVQLFGNVLAGWNHIVNNTRGPSWTSDAQTTGYFLNQETGDYETWSRSFAPEEIGGVDSFDQRWNDFSGILTAGIQGDLGSSSWKYSATYSASLYTSHNIQPGLLSSVDSYFLGPQLGVDGSGVPIYAPNPARFDSPLTAAQFDSLIGTASSQNNSALQTFVLNANGHLFNLPAGPVAAASTLEWGDQGFDQHPDTRINDGYFYDAGGDYASGGSRTHYAAGLELSVPVVANLTAKLASRFDEYSFAERREGRPTYSASVDYRPVQQVRIFGNYATSFRAPDMNYIFQAQSKGYFGSTTDYYQCALANQPLATCPYNNYSPGANYTQLGSQNLGFENGRSFDFGVSMTPIEQVEFSVDYWNLRIDNEVTLIDAQQLLLTDSQCLLGQLNVTSAQCVQALDLVQRNPANAVLNPNTITNITIYPINAAYERTDGLDVGGKVHWSIPIIGDFLWNTSYTRVMSHYFDQGPGFQPLDLVRSFNNPNGTPDFPDKLTTTLTWTRSNWSSTVEVDRYGAIINEALDGYLTPTAIVNLSVEYKLGNATLGFIVNNVFDTVKKDASDGWPFYAVGYYSPYGRQGWLEFSYHFGPGGK